MANYFSNHSQSRFLTGSGQQSLSHPEPIPTRSRLPSSKHFSTSLSHPTEEKPSRETVISNSSPSQSSGVHPFRNTWVFWFRQQRLPGNKIANYEEGIKKISAFSSIESFWSLWTHLNPPSALLPTTDYLLFHSGVRRPVWEDPLNLSGGKWIIRLKKGVADRIWEDLVLAVIGDQFDGLMSENNIPEAGTGEDDGETTNYDTLGWPEICGCTISVRQSEDIISIWNRHEGDQRKREKIRDLIRKVLNLPLATVMEYKSNNDSMQDKSSFRNSAIDRS